MHLSEGRLETRIVWQILPMDSDAQEDDVPRASMHRVRECLDSAIVIAKGRQGRSARPDRRRNPPAGAAGTPDVRWHGQSVLSCG
jgi:hypothetical protein